jgi:hypothetical protein
MAKIDNIPCSVCRRTPTRRLTIRRHQGIIVFMRFFRIDKSLCRDHGIALTRSALKQTAAQGWWGVLSVFINLYDVLWDLRVLAGYKRMPAAPPIPQPAAGGRIQMRRLDGTVMPTPF